MLTTTRLHVTLASMSRRPSTRPQLAYPRRAPRTWLLRSSLQSTLCPPARTPPHSLSTLLSDPQLLWPSLLPKQSVVLRSTVLPTRYTYFDNMHFDMFIHIWWTLFSFSPQLSLLSIGSICAAMSVPRRFAPRWCTDARINGALQCDGLQ
ncbi:unnamed protein product [Protopolystoma xenopodis]|uniref:Uncharacterized protein n=1 Tax=Protopolystoma xenopodis TaxID=117903 RepID=A0A3S5B5A6_9PLAT|nr:unnamed protein product [Protopolystoma xenopodis]